MDANEPTVVNEELIRSCIAVNKSESVGDAAAEEGRRQTMPLKEVHTLLMSFKNIKHIANLRGLSNLTKLQLDNNSICKIENLSHLTMLTWLDLSFNAIRKVEGLESLSHLTDLSLFSNRIESIEGLSTLTSLSVLSLGNNLIKSLDNVNSLRKLRGLRLINLEGNPFCKDPEYRSYVVAHLKDLKYLDYRLVENATVLASREQYQDEMLEVEEEEEVAAAREKEASAKAQEQALLAEANLTGVDTLFEDMLAEDPEYSKLKLMPGLLDGLTEFREHAAGLVEEFRTLILEQHRKRTEEMRLWQAAVRHATERTDDNSRKLVVTYSKMKKKVLAEVHGDPTLIEARVEGPLVANDRLRDQLLDVEMHLQDNIQGLWTEFDKSYSEIMEANKQHYANFFNALRTRENTFFDSCSAAAVTVLEKFGNGELEDLDDDCRMLLQDKDTLLNALQASHDTHTSKIDGLEDARVQRELAMYAMLSADNRKWETQRNRERISDVWNLTAKNRHELEQLQMKDADQSL